MKRTFWLLIAVLFPIVSRPAPRPPNIVFILADDLGWTDLTCYGSTFYETPNLDRLASQGMRFTQAYAACPVCSPTRASIMTGKYPARVKLTDYIGGKKAGALIPADYLDHLPLEELTIAKALKPSGYATAHFGKWHLGNKEFLPPAQGFDLSVANGNGAGHPPSYFYPFSQKNKPDVRIELSGKQGDYLTDRLTDEVLAFIDAHKDAPFYIYLPHYAVHNPQQGKPELVEKYKQKLAKLPRPAGPEFIQERERQDRQVQNQPTYAAMMQSLDENVGRVMTRLHDLGLDDNTIVVFTSDNGGLSTSEGSPTSNVPLRAGKGWLYEGGVREPLIVRYPPAIKPGSTSDAVVVSTDYYPTLLDLANLPAQPKQHVDGVSFAKLLKGEPAPAQRATPVFWHYPHYGNQGGRPGGAVRAGDFKLIEWFEDMSVELYNIKDDLRERNDLASKMPDKVNELRTILHDWRKSVDANMPKPNPKPQPN